MDKIVFLDIDGVINLPKRGGYISNCDDLDEISCLCLKSILDSVEAFIVITSTWRLHGWAIEALKQQLKLYGIYSYRIVGYTPDLSREVDYGTYENLRWLEISRYIEERGVESYVIIDDLDLSKFLSDRFVKTNTHIGLTDELAEKCIKILKEQH